MVDLKPDNLEDLSEVITCARYHPVDSNVFLYATSKGVIRVADMRKSSICDQTAMQFQREEESSKKKKNFFTDIISSITDVSFAADGRQIITRDFLTASVWDVRK